MKHEFNFKTKFSKEIKNEIIENRTKKLILKGNSEIEARKRAKQEMMPSGKWSKYAKIAQFICDQHNIPTDSDHIQISTNRYGEHSWYIMTGNMAIRISDHLKKANEDGPEYHLQIVIDKNITIHNESILYWSEMETNLKNFGVDYFKFIIKCIGMAFDYSKHSSHKDSLIYFAETYTKDFHVSAIPEKVVEQYI